MAITTASKKGRRALISRDQGVWCRPPASSKDRKARRLVPVNAFRDPLPFQLFIEVAKQDGIKHQQKEEDKEDMFAGEQDPIKEHLDVEDMFTDQKEEELVVVVSSEEDLFAEVQDPIKEQLDVEDMFGGGHVR